MGGCCREVSPYKGSCGFILSTLKWIPVLVISSIVVWSYYAYVVHLCILTVESLPEKVILLLLYHLLFFLFTASYWRTVWTRPGDIPSKFQLSPSELDAVENCESEESQGVLLQQLTVAKDIGVAMRSIGGSVRFCEKCSAIKPDRAHHCSVCGACRLKMDHHCPWVNNCVAFFNYKFFILFLAYGLLYCLFIALSTVKYFILFWTKTADGQIGQGKFHILFLFFVSTMFCISLCSLLGYHIHLVLNNRTTLEAFRAPVFTGGPDKQGFSLGKLGNLCEVFGDSWLTASLPIFTSLGDGLTFPRRLDTGQERDLEAGMHSSEIREDSNSFKSNKIAVKS